jgi:hypothetical protein
MPSKVIYLRCYDTENRQEKIGQQLFKGKKMADGGYNWLRKGAEVWAERLFWEHQWSGLNCGP